MVRYFVARPSRDLIVAARQESTRELWPKLISECDCYVSLLVVEEVSQGESEQESLRSNAIRPLAILETDRTASELATTIVAGGGILRAYPEDAHHIATAAVNGMDVLITWNSSHMNNPFSGQKVRRITECAGYQCPEICTPDELSEAMQ